MTNDGMKGSVLKVYLGADHRGFELKERLKTWLRDNGYEVKDMGPYKYDKSDDYPDFAHKVVEAIKSEDDKGILMCGSGHGMDMAANRFAHIRAIVGFNEKVTVQGREHEDVNVLSIPTDWVNEGEMKDIVKAFLGTEFSGEERHVRRLRKIKNSKLKTQNK